MEEIIRAKIGHPIFLINFDFKNINGVHYTINHIIKALCSFD